MDIPTPDSVTITRSTQTGNVYGGETTVASAVACMIVPAGEDMAFTAAGRADEGEIILICDPTYELEHGDKVVDDNTGAAYRVKETQGPQRNPLTWEAHHQEVVMVPDAM